MNVSTPAASSASEAAPAIRTPVAWFCDPPARGSWNMALDEALLHEAAAGGPAVLRFYQWKEPTLSLGYFQQYADRERHAASAGCACVRRATGGGAILHDRELTYSCTLPPGHALGRRAGDLYNAVHAAIVTVLTELGLPAQLLGCAAEAARCVSLSRHQTAMVERAASPEPFLCFQRRTRGDIVLDGHKVVGSAQRRHRGAVLQHGSILFERSRFAAELPGIRDLCGRQIEIPEFADRLRNVLAEGLGFDLGSCPPSSEIMDRAAALEAAKFAVGQWLVLR